MAREESDREDLLREATALVERAELRVPDETETVVVGFRRNGAASFFFGADPVYQFNTGGELRRAYVDGKLYKAEGGALVELTRVRTECEVRLERQEIPSVATQSFLTAMASRLRQLHDSLATATIVGQVPPEADVVRRTQSELVRIVAATRLADSPRVG